ncbi:aminopeptidase P family protein [uncultured Blautia sp.]|uniref:aminopeptidase P family protein n=1 Tax=uncultured Blautia sp. TaxID=765821 RepID=UPI00280BFA0C|nr:aminopeptidase P family protein [uncultured Blautia sp.]
MTVTERLSALRALMKEKGVDAYLVPTDDFHASEYVGDYFKCRKYITGFTGSAGTAVITMDMAGLWTDGRYFIQAAQQLEGTTVELFKMGEPEVPTIHEFLKEKLTEGMCLGFDGRTVSAAEAEELKELLSDKKIRFSVEEDLIGEIWTERPALSCEPVMELDIKWAGESRAEKCARVRRKMQEKQADVFVLTSLDDIAWLLNIRGNDIHCCPVVLSYLVLTEEEALLFANEKAFGQDVLANLKKDGVVLKPYNDIYTYVNTIPAGKTVILSKANVNSRLVNSLPAEVKILDEENLTLLPKAIKNHTEVENERIAHIKDGVAVTKFIYWLKQNVGKMEITELSAAEHLFQLRKEQENFLDNSFDPIVSYGGHAAMCHYSPSPETDIPLEPKGLALCDTGGHYLEGSTDITRTIALGELTEKEQKYFTLVLKGHLRLSDARFHYGCCGQNLDYLAREPLWRLGEDYNHGTGHGVGYLLNIHEGPNSFRWKSSSAVLEEGMITSNEPGYYVENEFGIRHENLIVCKKAEKTAYGQFMCFENLTMVPFDLDAINPELLDTYEKGLLNSYHAEVYEKISPYLTEEEKNWLKEYTRAI